MAIFRALFSYTCPEVTLLLYARGDRTLPREQRGCPGAPACPSTAGTPLPGSGASGRAAPPERGLGCPQSPAGAARARPPSEPLREPGCPQSPARLRRDGAGTGSTRPSAPCGTCCPQTPARGWSQPRGGCGDTAATPRHLTRLPAPQPGHRDCVPHCGTSALPQHGDARAEAAGSPQPCQCPRAALTSPRSPAAAAALGDAPQPEPSAHLHRPHRPPGGCQAARRVM